MYLSMDRRALAHIDPRSFRLLFLFTICVPIRVSSFNFSSPYLPSRSFHRQSIKYNHSFLFLNYLNLLLRTMNAGSVFAKRQGCAVPTSLDATMLSFLRNKSGDAFFFLGNRGVRVRQYVRVIIRGDIFPSNGRDAIRVWQLVAYTRESVFQKKKEKKRNSLSIIYIYI